MKNIAVIGFGFMGLTHTITILKSPDLKLVAIVDKNPDNIPQNLRTQVGNFSTGAIPEEVLSSIHSYSDFDECLNHEKLDACVIAVHTDLHYEMAKKALRAGLHVFLEKPICLDVASGVEMIEMARQNQLLLMVGHVVRFMPSYLKLKHWIDSGELGALKFLSLSRFSGLPAWGQWKDKQTAFGSSGGALFDLVIHDIDFAQWVLGEPDRITSSCLPGKLSNQDYVNSLWKYTSKGVHVKIEGGNTFHSAFPFHAGFSAQFENASVLFSSNSPQNILLTTDSESSMIPVGDANEGFSGEMNYFTSCMLNNKLPDICTPDSALQTVRLCYKHLSVV